RGAHSIPLFEYVNVADIDRIEVLRGPAATIEYGSDAADGVIRIYTRRGRGDGVPADSTSQCKATGDSAISPVR
ncbi:MAG: TonB-dependent receptor plug domain-containing protein, partial [Acidimicrobiia bacterium]